MTKNWPSYVLLFTVSSHVFLPSECVVVCSIASSTSWRSVKISDKQEFHSPYSHTLTLCNGCACMHRCNLPGCGRSPSPSCCTGTEYSNDCNFHQSKRWLIERLLLSDACRTAQPSTQQHYFCHFAVPSVPDVTCAIPFAPLRVQRARDAVSYRDAEITTCHRTNRPSGSDRTVLRAVIARSLCAGIENANPGVIYKYSPLEGVEGKRARARAWEKWECK